MEWISVKDKMPQEDERVLAFTNSGDIILAYYDNKWREVIIYIEYDIDSYFNDEIDGCGIFVSHWMPLPPPPEVK